MLLETVQSSGVLRERQDLDARASLREQIGRLERRLGALAFELGTAGRAQRLPGPASDDAPHGSAARILSFAELEAVRDGLVSRVRAAEQALEHRLDSEARARQTLDAMLSCPSAHRFEFVERATLGEAGCGAYQVRPRLGLLGMLFDWWCVKLSSGCP